MAGWQQRRPSAPQNNGQELWAKDRTMASMNAATIASQLVQLEYEYAKLVGEDTDGLTSPSVRFEELYDKVYAMHLQKGGDVGAAVASVTRAFPTASVGVEGGPPVDGGQYTEPQVGAGSQSGPGGDVLVTFGKHSGKSIAQVYGEDPSYIRNYLVEKAREESVRAACRAYLTWVDNG